MRCSMEYVMGPLLFVLILGVSDAEQVTDHQVAGRIVSYVSHDIIDEASGLAVSRRHTDILYTHNDSGGKPRVFAVRASTGELVATLNFIGENVKNCDWEDLSVGPISSTSNDSYIYVGDIGGNAWGSYCNVIYRVKEPEVLSGDMEVRVDGRLHFKYSAGNCETLMVDETGVVWLVSKVKKNIAPRLYNVPVDAWNSSETDLGEGVELPLGFPYSSPTGGDISDDGRFIIIKAYYMIIGYTRQPNETITEVLQRNGTLLPYVPEKQGEAVCWTLDGSGYYTLSEGEDQAIWYYNNTLMYPSINWTLPKQPSAGSGHHPGIFVQLLSCLMAAMCYMSRH